MPNWRKVIVSGSDALLNSVSTAPNIINALTASWATNATTTALNSGTVIEIATPSTTWTLNHSVSERYPIVTCWESGSNEIIQPDTVRSININTVQVTFTTPVAGFANVSRAGHVLSGSQGVVLWSQLGGSSAVTASGLFGGFTGSLQGTASYALIALSADKAISSSFASNALIANTATSAVTATSASFASTSLTASYALSAASAATLSSTASQALTASYLAPTATASLASNSVRLNGQAASFYYAASNPNGYTTNTGTVTSVQGTGTVSGLSLTGLVTTSGNIALSGTISGLTTSNLSSTAGITNSQLANSTITIAGNSISLGGSVTQNTILAGSTVLSGSVTTYLPTGTVSGSAQITNIANSQLANNSVTVGSTTISLGATSTTLAGLSSVTSTTFVGALTGNASTSTTASFAATASRVNTLNQNVVITGSLTVGATTAGVSENTLTLGPRDNGSEGGQLMLQAPGGTFTTASMFDNYANTTRLLRGTNNGSDGVIMQWNMHTRQAQLPAYNSTSAFPGTAAAFLAVDSSGNLITTSSAGAGGSVTINNNFDNYLITGTGTLNTLNGESNLQFNGSSLSVTGQITASGAIISNANGAMYFRGGDDAEFWDINVANTVGIYGQQNQTVGGLKLGSNGATLYGTNGRFGIGTLAPVATLDVNGNLFVASGITGSLQGNASTATTATTATSASFASTASRVNILRQNVIITGSLSATGDISTEGSINVAGSITDTTSGYLKWRGGTTFFAGGDNLTNITAVNDEGVSSVNNGSTLDQWMEVKYNGTVLTNQTAAGNAIEPGQLISLRSNGTWELTDADTTNSTQLLGISLSSVVANASELAVLLEGQIATLYHDQLGTATPGTPLYISSPTAGNITQTAPTGSGQYVRLIGHNIYNNTDVVVIRFRPDNTWIEL